MKLDFSLDELRVVSHLADQVMKHHEISARIFAGQKNDIDILLGIAGKFRAVYEMEKKLR